MYFLYLHNYYYWQEGIFPPIFGWWKCIFTSPLEAALKKELNGYFLKIWFCLCPSHSFLVLNHRGGKKEIELKSPLCLLADYFQRKREREIVRSKADGRAGCHL